MIEDLDYTVRVLWVENDPIVLDAYPLEADQYGIELVPVSCWDDAERELKKNYQRWDAIILDAKCKVHNDSMDKANSFLVTAFSSLAGLAAENSSIKPWFVLSGGEEEEIADLIPETREQWDVDRPQKYYQKALSAERKELWRRIPLIVKDYSNVVKLKSGPCKDVFRAIKECGMPDAVENYMLCLLLPIYFETTLKADYNDRFHYARKIIEHLFRSMVDHRIMPAALFPYGKVNLTWCCKFLMGKPSVESKVEIYNQIMTRVMAGNLLNIVNVSGSLLHSPGADEEKSKDIHPYFEQVSKSPFLLQSFALQLCDVFIWYNMFLAEHRDAEINALNWNEIKE